MRKPSTIARLFLVFALYLPTWFVHVRVTHGPSFLPGGKHPILGMLVTDIILMGVCILGGIIAIFAFLLALAGEFDA